MKQLIIWARSSTRKILLPVQSRIKIKQMYFHFKRCKMMILYKKLKNTLRLNLNQQILLPIMESLNHMTFKSILLKSKKESRISKTKLIHSKRFQS